MSAYEALLATQGPCVLFESTTTGGSLARRSLLARHPRAVLVADCSAVVADGTVTFHAGGGIVADSEPDFEYTVTLAAA
jgi:anthranilate/para-aminobenzoate synthase component I